jgi:mRNA-degrading endonuclease toxin of MazEF toxin-antitoxin module
MRQGEIWEICLDPSSAIDCFQIRSVSVDRLTIQCGHATPEIVVQTQEAIATLIGYI